MLAADAKLASTVIGIIVLAQIAFLRNDFLIDRGALLQATIAGKIVFTCVAAASIVMLRRAKRPRTYDRAMAMQFAAMMLTIFIGCYSRSRVGEYQGPLISYSVYVGVVYFSLRGPLLPRAIAAGIPTVAALVLARNPLAHITPIGRNAATIGLVALNVIGFCSTRAFEAERRKRFAAEQQEKRARLELAGKMHELAAEKERALALSRARTSFLAAMSHEFRTPMNAVIGLSDLLVDAPLAPEQRDHVLTIRDSARSLLVLLNDILDFTKIEADKLTLSGAPIDVRAFASSVVDMLRPAAMAKSLEIELDIAPEVPEGLWGDETRLRQVLVNLLSNAVKFTHEGKVALRLSATARGEDGHELFVRVEDTGIGIDPSALGRLFQPFEQADQGITRRYGGTGLGLAISREIVRAMGGDIHVETAPGKGSVFSFSVVLPESAPPPRVNVNASIEPRAGGRALSILVVDDHPMNRRVALAVLDRLGYGADVAKDGRDAVLAAKRKNYDVILMDLQMPGMSGIEATRQICEGLAGQPMPRIVAMTASVFEEDREACRAAGMTDFVGKPIDARELDAVLSRAQSLVEKRPTAPPELPSGVLSPGPLEKLRELEAFGEPGFVASLCREFIVDTKERLSRMEQAREAGAAKNLEREAHGLKSASASLGAEAMSKIAAALERAAHEGTLADAGERIRALSSEFVLVERALLEAIEKG